MLVKQLFYTSCKKGLSLGMGFQTYAMSKGISEEERKEIESHCIYIPPDNLPTQPTQEEIEKLFPIAFSSFRLKSGKYCISQSKYVGKDYSGRYGNYFSHVIISNEPWPFYPIEIYGSSIFKDRLTLEEENSNMDFLKDLEEVPLGDKIELNKISKFLKESTKDRRIGFKNLIDAIVSYKREGKTIIFSDYKENIPYLIGAVQMALPKEAAQRISFTTYSYNPENLDYSICALDKEGSKFNIKDSKNLQKYNIVDVSGKENVLIANTNFSKLLEVGYTVSKEIFLSFLSFLQKFEYKTLDTDIEDCICLYNIVNKGIQRLNVENVKKAISFANKYKSNNTFEEIFKHISPNLEKISSEVDIELTEVIAEFLFNMSEETGKKSHIKTAYSFFFNSVHCIVVDGEHVDNNDILQLYKKVRGWRIIHKDEFLKNSLSKERLNDLSIYLNGSKGKHAKFYFQSIVDDIITFNKQYCNEEKIELFYCKTLEDKNRTKLLEQCIEILISSPEDMEMINHYFKDDYEYLSKIVIREYILSLKKEETKSIKDILAEFVISEGKKDIYWKKKIYLNMNNFHYGIDFMFYVFKVELSKEIDNKNFFLKYCEETFDVFSQYKEKKFFDALEFYINFFGSANTSVEQYEKLFNYIYTSSFEKGLKKDVLTNFIEGFEDTIDFEDLGAIYDFIEKVKLIKDKYKIKTAFSITEPVCMYKNIEEYEFMSKIKLLDGFKVDFSRMNVYRYQKCLQWILPMICMYLQDYTEHAKLKKVLFCKEYSDVYYKTYSKVIGEIALEKKYKNKAKNVNKDAYEIFIDFIIFMFKNKFDYSEETKKYIEDKVMDILQNSSEKNMRLSDNYLMIQIREDKKEKSILKAWEKSKEKARENNKNKNIFSFLKNKIRPL